MASLIPFSVSVKAILRGRRLTSVRNRGELAERWYDPATLKKAQESAALHDEGAEPIRPRGSPRYDEIGGWGSNDEELFGPMPPSQQGEAYAKAKKSGPRMPDLQDLELRRGREIYRQTMIDHTSLLTV